jgi:hypothetical protein
LNPIKGDAIGLGERASYREAWWSNEMFIDLGGLARLQREAYRRESGKFRGAKNLTETILTDPVPF